MPFRLLVIADIHYVSDPTAAAEAPASRHVLLGRELLRRAIEDARRRGGFDAIALMGDLLEDGRAPYALADLRALRAEIDAAAPEGPLLVVAGNHDDHGEAVLDAFGARTGLVELGGYRFCVFCDAYEEAKYGTRRESDRRLLRELARRPGGPLVALQHNPMNPPIDSDYPFMLTNRREVLRDYADAGVLLSISGHYHAGQPLNAADGVRFYTAPALAEQPFPYALVTLDGQEVSVEERRLSLEPLPVIDTHAHTEFAYCGRDISAAGAIERARRFGLSGICLTEHAPQLYCTAEAFWAARHVHDPAVWRAGRHSRMADFRRAMEPLRSDFVRIGLEVELDADGCLTLREEDRAWVDRILGAIHWLPEDISERSDAAAASAFLRANEALLACGVDVLAHPCRYLRACGRPVPRELHAELAQMLADTDTAAEINLHINEPAVAFVRECIERGVKIAFGSDAHQPWEVALLAPNVSLLAEAAGGDDVARYLLG